MAEEARSRGLFLMEAIWSRFLPAYRSLVEVIGEGRIGEPLLVEADFGFRRPVDPEHRHFARELGGGALLDLGIYPVQLCTLVLGPIERVVADGVVGETGVDEVVTALLHHPGDRLGVVKAALRVGMTCTARIAGTDGVIDLPAMMHCPNSLTVSSPAGVEHIDASLRGKRAPLRDRRGAPLPRRGADREHGRPPGRVDRPGHDARRHPGRARRGLSRANESAGTHLPQPVEHLAGVGHHQRARGRLPTLGIDGVGREVAEVGPAHDVLGDAGGQGDPDALVLPSTGS